MCVYIYAKKKQKKQYSRSLEIGSTGKSPGILIFLFYWFFCFLEVFLIFAFFHFYKSSGIFFCWFYCFFWFSRGFLFFLFFRFTVASDIFLKKHFPLPAFGIHYFSEKTAFPKIFPAIYFKLLSLKTGLFQREVPSREESSILTNRLCVKQDFV